MNTALGFDDDDEFTDDNLLPIELLTTSEIGMTVGEIAGRLSITFLVKGGQAEAAGIKVGDQIRTVDSQYIFSQSEWNQLIQTRQENVQVTFDMSHELPGVNDGHIDAAADGIDDHTFTIDVSRSLGMAIDHPAEGNGHYPAVITQLQPGGQAALKGVQVGMHVHTINGMSCRDKKLGFVIDVINKGKKAARLNLLLEPRNNGSTRKEIITGVINNGPLGVTFYDKPGNGLPDVSIKTVAKNSQADLMLPGLKKNALLVQVGTQNVRNLNFGATMTLLKTVARPMRLVFENASENEQNKHERKEQEMKEQLNKERKDQEQVQLNKEKQQLGDFKWNSKNNGAMNEDDRKTLNAFISSLSLHLFHFEQPLKDECVRACNSCDYRKDAETMVRAVLNGLRGEELFALAPGSGGVPDFMWPTYGLPHAPMSNKDIGFARNFAASVAEVSLVGDDGTSNKNISPSEAKTAISKCSSRRQVECVLNAMCNDGNKNVIFASTYVGKWLYSKKTPPTALEKASANKAKKFYSSQSDGNDGQNVVAAVAIDVAGVYLGLTYKLLSMAKQTVYRATNDAMRASMLEMCLDMCELKSNNKNVNQMFNNMDTHNSEHNFDRLLRRINGSVFPNNTINKAIEMLSTVPALYKNETTRLTFLIDLFITASNEGVTTTGSTNQQEEEEDRELYGETKINIDASHRNEFEKVLSSVITFDEKKKKCLIASVHQAREWSQLVEIFICAIRGDSNRKITKTSRRRCNNPLYDGEYPTAYLSHIKDDVRMSYMFEGTHGDRHRMVQEELDEVRTHFELAKALLDVIEQYSSTMSEMAEKRKTSRIKKKSYKIMASDAAKVETNAPAPTISHYGHGNNSWQRAFDFLDEKLRFIPVIETCTLIRDDLRVALKETFETTTEIGQCLNIITTALIASKSDLPKKSVLVKCERIARTNYAEQTPVEEKEELNNLFQVLKIAAHRDSANTIARAKREIRLTATGGANGGQKNKNIYFECMEVVLLSYERAVNHTTHAYDVTNATMKRQIEKQKSLEHSIQQKGGDILGHINSLNDQADNAKSPSSAREQRLKKLPPVLTQREAMAKIKGVDLFRKSSKKKKTMPMVKDDGSPLSLSAMRAAYGGDEKYGGTGDRLGDKKNRAKITSPSAMTSPAVEKKNHHQYHHHHDLESGEAIPGKHHTGHHKHKHDSTTGAVILGEHVHHYHHQGQMMLGKPAKHLVNKVNGGAEEANHHQYHHHHDPDTGEAIKGLHKEHHHHHRHDPELGLILHQHEHHYHHRGQMVLGKPPKHLLTQINSGGNTTASATGTPTRPAGSSGGNAGGRKGKNVQ